MTLPLSWFPEIARSLEEALFEGRIAKIRSPSPHEIVFTVRAGEEKLHLLVSSHPRFPRLHLLPEFKSQGASASNFAMTLRKHVQGARVLSVLAVPGDRIVEIGLGKGGASFRLVAECIPGKANLVLAGEAGKILGVLRRKRERDRTLAPGQEYHPPSPPPRKDPEGEALPKVEDIHAWLYENGRCSEAEHSRARFVSAIQRRHRRLLRKERRKLENLRRDRGGAGDPEQLRRRGELLKIHAGRVEKGIRSVEVPDLFEPNSPVVTIPLDPRLDLEGNIEACFRAYRKAKNGLKKIEALLVETAERIERLQARASRLEEASLAGDDGAILELGEIAGVEPPLEEKPAPRKRKAPEARELYRRFVSLEGFPIWVGRNDAENDRLSTREARGRDLWLHVDGFGGSHVLVRLPKDKTPPRETLLDAANLAAFFSQARGRRVDVTYTEAKHVRKPRKGKPGLVTLSRRSTIRIEPDGPRLERLFGKPPTFRR